MALALSRQSSSSLLIWWKVMGRARSCSCSEGTLTSQDRNERSSIRGDHCVVSQTMSFELCIAAQGCLHCRKIGSAHFYPGEPNTRCKRTHRQSKTTTVSLLAGMNPRMKTFLAPQE